MNDLLASPPSSNEGAAHIRDNICDAIPPFSLSLPAAAAPAAVASQDIEGTVHEDNICDATINPPLSSRSLAASQVIAKEETAVAVLIDSPVLENNWGSDLPDIDELAIESSSDALSMSIEVPLELESEIEKGENSNRTSLSILDREELEIQLEEMGHCDVELTEAVAEAAAAPVSLLSSADLLKSKTAAAAVKVLMEHTKRYPDSDTDLDLENNFDGVQPRQSIDHPEEASFDLSSSPILQRGKVEAKIALNTDLSIEEVLTRSTTDPDFSNGVSKSTDSNFNEDDVRSSDDSNFGTDSVLKSIDFNSKYSKSHKFMDSKFEGSLHESMNSSDSQGDARESMYSDFSTDDIHKSMESCRKSLDSDFSAVDHRCMDTNSEGKHVGKSLDSIFSEGDVQESINSDLYIDDMRGSTSSDLCIRESFDSDFIVDSTFEADVRRSVDSNFSVGDARKSVDLFDNVHKPIDSKLSLDDVRRSVNSNFTEDFTAESELDVGMDDEESVEIGVDEEHSDLTEDFSINLEDDIDHGIGDFEDVEVATSDEKQLFGKKLSMINASSSNSYFNGFSSDMDAYVGMSKKHVNFGGDIKQDLFKSSKVASEFDEDELTDVDVLALPAVSDDDDNKNDEDDHNKSETDDNETYNYDAGIDNNDGADAAKFKQQYPVGDENDELIFDEFDDETDTKSDGMEDIVVEKVIVEQRLEEVAEKENLEEKTSEVMNVVEKAELVEKVIQNGNTVSVDVLAAAVETKTSKQKQLEDLKRQWQREKEQLLERERQERVRKQKEQEELQRIKQQKDEEDRLQREREQEEREIIFYLQQQKKEESKNALPQILQLQSSESVTARDHHSDVNDGMHARKYIFYNIIGCLLMYNNKNNDIDIHIN